MELCSEPEWLLPQILGWKARPIGLFGQAIELWVCAQRFVCVCGLAWSRMGFCSRRVSTTPRRWRASSRRTKTTCVDPCANQIHSRSCLALNNQPLPFFLATLHLLTLKHTLGLLHRLNAQLRQRHKKDPHTHTQRCAHTQSSIACPNGPIGRAFPHKICNNNHSGSEHSSITCDGSNSRARRA